MGSIERVRFTIPDKCDFEMELDLSKRTQRMMVEEHRLSGFYEGMYSISTAALLKHGETVVDVGAHVGYFTLLCAACVGPEGHVVAFEPEPENFAALERNVSINGFDNVTLINRAVGSESGPVSFYFNSDNDGGHAVWDVRRDPNNRLSRQAARRFDTVRTTLDEVFADSSETLAFIKIDAEGSERDVFEGARLLFEKRCVACLMWERNAEAFAKMGYTEMDIRSFAAAYGYQTAGFRNGRLSVLSQDEILTPGQEINLFFFRRPLGR